MNVTSPALASQATFRALMDAFARPGTIHTLQGTGAPAPLATATAAIVQTLVDYETPVWLDQELRDVPAVADWIRFQSGAPMTTAPSEAAFALIADAHALPDITTFALGSEEYPDRSTTLIVQIERFDGTPFTLSGPGIKGQRNVRAAPLPDDFARHLRANRDVFPRGVDLVLVAGDLIMALPRSIRVSQGA